MSEQKIEQFWRDATAEDVAKVMRGETVDARFCRTGSPMTLEAWRFGTLLGWTRGGKEWYCDTNGHGFYGACQVYDPPEWFKNKPVPGEGWRLLEKFPDEEPLSGDSVFCPDSKRWLKLDARFDPGQRHGIWYRRRIEPVEPVEMVAYQAEVGEVIEFPCGIKLAATAKGFEVEQ